MAKELYFRKEDLENHIIRFLTTYSVSEEDAKTIAGVLMAADLRGVHSHGITRLHVYYGDRLRAGLIDSSNPFKVLKETSNTAVYDGGNGFGQVCGFRAMTSCIDKAKDHAVGLATVRNSNHFGIAGYYAMLALKQNMIGVSLTNSQPLIAPTYGKTRMLGTNPIAVAVPAGDKRPYVLDMATSIVPMGKVMLAETKGASIPAGYGIDARGEITTDPSEVKEGGALLPLGGTDIMSGYKGYGLALLVDILCGVLSGASFGSGVGSPASTSGPNVDIGHFFMAVNIGAFRPLDDFTRDMDRLLEELVSAPKASGQKRIYIHGEKEFEKMADYEASGIPLPAAVVDGLKVKGREAGVPFDLNPIKED